MELQHDDEADLEVSPAFQIWFVIDVIFVQEVRATEGAGTEYMGAKEKARANRYKRKKPKVRISKS